MRRVVMAVAVLAVAGCSGSDPTSSTEVTSAPTTTAAVTTTLAAATGPADTATSEPAVPASVRIDVDVAGRRAELSGLVAESEDPFGQFVACSGLRESYGTYSVLASTTAGDVRSISVVSDAAITGPGVVEASMRLEFGAAPAIDASGTMTLSDDLQAGSYVMFDAAGTSIEGTFACRGGASPQPLEVGEADGVLDAIEVFAILSRGDEQRLLGLAVAAGTSASIECPGAVTVASDSDFVVRVDGDATTGAISTFELTSGDAPTMRLRAGTADYEFDQVRRGAGDEPTAGTFSAASEGVSVDGAFRCS